ncbi:MAG: hypothetical protein MZV70_29545 [Desulfobacterales bacterium]|nr:hypothetical protein [Desulfobacterales bacterium]
MPKIEVLRAGVAEVPVSPPGGAPGPGRRTLPSPGGAAVPVFGPDDVGPALATSSLAPGGGHGRHQARSRRTGGQPEPVRPNVHREDRAGHGHVAERRRSRAGAVISLVIDRTGGQGPRRRPRP